jgi:hypothetical protein
VPLSSAVVPLASGTVAVKLSGDACAVTVKVVPGTNSGPPGGVAPMLMVPVLSITPWVVRVPLSATVMPPALTLLPVPASSVSESVPSTETVAPATTPRLLAVSAPSTLTV